MIPITDDQSKAIAEAAKLGTVVVTEGSNLARYVGRVLGTAPDNAVGLIIGDPLGFVRTAIAHQYDVLLDRILKKRGIKETQPVSPSVAIPMLRAAYDEGRPELQALWAELIAAAMDPKRSDLVRLSFIETLKRFDPLDALILKSRYANPGEVNPNAVTFFSNFLKVERDEVQVSVQNLVDLGCVNLDMTGVGYFLLPKGRLLMGVCSPAP
jgi:hypothetical protein